MRKADQRGSVSLYALMCVTTLVTVAIGVLALGALVAAEHRAAAAADLAALAAAAAISDGSNGCAAAVDIAKRNGAQLHSCQVDANTVEVSVRVRAPVAPFGVSATLTSRARAGPSALSGS